ncbi:cytochrome P450 [Saccharopolyspora gloriosae]|uniref:Cytochrome P450 n=1 Tax=Saccharopolyspora gloriosae TaxID=455344 RepID=A0A840NA36_9PSEU|nr:cytochrome P450 [Saccharopolyspora gloriosae]MBB5067243.1 cytochrome P450 [Saccharopolyspora gloriosae]
MNPIPADLTEIDLTDPQTFLDLDPIDMWRRFRAERPVHRHRAIGGAPGFWAVTRHADLMSVYRDNKRFTSERGNVLATLLQGHDSAAGKMMAVTDGPRHKAIRKLVLESFSPRVLKHVVGGIHERTRALLDQALELGSFDFATDVADHVPIGTIGDLMDIPQADRPPLVRWNTLTLSRHSSDEAAEDELMARNEILMYFSDLARRRRRKPGEDVISALATGLVDGEPLSEDEIVFNCYSLILGGDESSRMSSIGAVKAFSEFPEQWRALKAGEADVESATEEVLRWTTPAMHFGRRALQDVPVGDQIVEAGDVVTLWNSSANFDEAVYTEPERFDLARESNKHLAFGFGPHFCIGAFLGRAHVGAMLEGLRDRVADVQVAGEPKRLYSNFVHGFSSLPVEFTA